MVTDRIKETFSIDGVAPVTLHDIDSRIDTLRETLVVEIHSALKSLRATDIESKRCI